MKEWSVSEKADYSAFYRKLYVLKIINLVKLNRPAQFNYYKFPQIPLQIWGF